MKHYLLLPFAFVLSAAALSCAHSDKPCDIEVDMKVAPDKMGDSIAAAYGCEQAANTIVEWLASDSPAELSDAQQLTQRIAYAYGDSMPRFLNAIDSISTTLTPERRVRLLLRTCPPEYLGHLVRQDPNDSVLVPIIERVLAPTPDKLVQFRRGYQISSSQHN